MIRKMKKLSLLVFHEDKVKTLDALASLGIVHIQTERGTTSESIERLNAERNRFLKAKSVVTNLIAKYNKDKIEISLDESKIDKTVIAEKIVDSILDFSEKLEHLQNEREALKKEYNIILPFGDFSFEKMKDIEQKTGYKASFYLASSKEFRAFDFSKMEDVFVLEIKEEFGKIYFVILKKEDTVIDIPFDIVSLPTRSLLMLKRLIDNSTESILYTEQSILSYKIFIEKIDKAVSEFNINTYFEEAISSFKPSENTDNTIFLVKAFVPLDKENSTKIFLNDNKIAYIMEDIKRGDIIPVQLKNNKYSGSYELITKLFQLPNYFEIDLTPMIAVFYPIFFAYCFGDSGYGIVLTILAIVGLCTKLKGKLFSVGVIALTLGILTTIMGVINSGVIFGVSFANIQHIQIFYELSKFTFITDTKKNWFFTPFNTALLCGLLQIFFALILSLINKIRYGEIGDIFGAIGKLLLIPGLVLWFLGDMQRMAVIRTYFHPMYYVLISVGLFFLVVLTNVGKKPDVLNSVLGVYFAATGIMGDTLSYIRLFALGASSSILGLVVNQIGGSFVSIPVVGIPVMVLFLIIGHSGNFALSILGSLVHPLRLTFVEFYNNVGFKGGGVEYKPLKKNEA